MTKLIYEPRDLVTEVLVGTNEETNLKLVRRNIYDEDAYENEADSKDGLLVRVEEPVDGAPSNDRITSYQYDCRNRQVAVMTNDGTNSFRDETEYDNQDRPTSQTGYPSDEWVR